MINDALFLFIDLLVIMFLDDILIFNHIWHENLLHVMDVLNTLHKN